MLYLIRNAIAVLFAIIVAGVLAGSVRVDANEGTALIPARDNTR